MGAKNAERECLDMVLLDQPSCAYGKEIHALLNAQPLEDARSDKERPDFVFGNLGIEHFLTDVIFTEKNSKAMSIDRKNSREIDNVINLRTMSGSGLDGCAEQEIMSKHLKDWFISAADGISGFRYDSFVRNFKSVYMKHYRSRDVYRQKCSILGFLIEMPYPQVIRPGYVVVDNGQRCIRQMRAVPFPKELLDFMGMNSGIDFIIICIRPLFGYRSGLCGKTCIVYINPKDMKVSNQGIVLCDRFDYARKDIYGSIAKMKHGNSRRVK